MIIAAISAFIAAYLAAGFMNSQMGYDRSDWFVLGVSISFGTIVGSIAGVLVLLVQGIPLS